MKITDRLQEIIDSLEQAIVYENMDVVSSSRDELIFILEDLQSGFSDVYNEEDEY